MRQQEAPTFRISGAARGQRQDVRSRQVRYLISMAFRTFCFIGAYFAGGVLRWVLIVLAFVLPYIAVVIANAGRDRRGTTIPAFVPDQRRSLDHQDARAEASDWVDGTAEQVRPPAVDGIPTGIPADDAPADGARSDTARGDEVPVSHRTRPTGADQQRGPRG